MSKSSQKKTHHGYVRSLFRRQNLSLKIIFYIGILLVIAILISFYLSNEAHEKEMLNLLQLQAHRLTDTIKASIRQEMIRDGNHSDIQSLLEAIGEREDITKVSILDRGRIVYSSWREEVSKECRIQDADCTLCHYSKTRPPLTVLIHRIFRDNTGNRSLSVFNPIQNESICFQCHPKDKQVLGILNVVTSLSRQEKSIMAGKKVMILSTIIIFFLVSLEIFFFIFRFVHIPIQRLKEATKRVAAGDIDHHIEVSSGDEIGDLARSFNTMTEKLKQSWSEIEKWNRELEKRVEDATARIKEANLDLQKTNRRLQIADQKKTDILVTVAHDIRGPLSAIKSCIGVILGGYLKNNQEKQTEMLVRTDQRVNELLRFTNDLLDLSLLDETWEEKDTIDCTSLVQVILLEKQKAAGERGVSIKPEIAAYIPPIKGDKNLLAKAFSYIIENAIKYSHREGSVVVNLLAQEGNICFTVQDEGIGIPENELPCIFEPTFRGALAVKHSQSGTGVSMALIERIVNAHRGKIHVESMEGKGTKVEVTMPSHAPLSE